MGYQFAKILGHCLRLESSAPLDIPSEYTFLFLSPFTGPYCACEHFIIFTTWVVLRNVEFQAQHFVLKRTLFHSFLPPQNRAV